MTKVLSVLATCRGLDHLAKKLDEPRLKTLTTDIADVQCAAQAIDEMVAKLAAGENMTREEAGSLLRKIQIWLYDELAEHLASLKGPLADAINALSSRPG